MIVLKNILCEEKKKNTVSRSQKLLETPFRSVRPPSPPLVCFDSSFSTYLNHKRQAAVYVCIHTVFSVRLISAETL